jgi:hypothetical protein
MHYPGMHGTHRPGTPISVRPRQIDGADVPEVVDLLTRGYEYKHPRTFWENIFAGLSHRSVPDGFPRYGYLIESDGKLVGALVLIFSTVWNGEKAGVRCCGSSMYIDPAFRIYASLLASRPLKNKNVTLLNITAAPHTHKMVEASGFIKFSNGIFVAIPLLSQAPKHAPVRIIGANEEPDARFNPHDRELLLEHAYFGCTSLWCVTDEQAFPFVFRSRRFKALPCAQLIYSSSVKDFVRFARPIGLYLARKLQLLVILDVNGPVPELVGRYRAKTPRYFLGPDPPRMGDLAYTETALFGIGI